MSTGCFQTYLMTVLVLAKRGATENRTLYRRLYGQISSIFPTCLAPHRPTVL
jgi:hypothetical protein